MIQNDFTTFGSHAIIPNAKVNTSSTVQDFETIQCEQHSLKQSLHLSWKENLHSSTVLPTAEEIWINDVVTSAGSNSVWLEHCYQLCWCFSNRLDKFSTPPSVTPVLKEPSVRPVLDSNWEFFGLSRSCRRTALPTQSRSFEQLSPEAHTSTMCFSVQ